MANSIQIHINFDSLPNNNDMLLSIVRWLSVSPCLLKSSTHMFSITREELLTSPEPRPWPWPAPGATFHINKHN